MNAFTTIKKALCNTPVMTYFNPNRQTKLIVDGSTKTCLSSILTQLDPETQLHRIVLYDSRSAMPQEQRYSHIEIESAAIESGVIKNHIYLYGLPEFTIITDHKPLVPTYSTFRGEPPPRMLKYNFTIQGYNYTFQYEPGGAANLADYLSRHTNNL